jgi:hypothetical protein
MRHNVAQFQNSVTQENQAFRKEIREQLKSLQQQLKEAEEGNRNKLALVNIQREEVNR